MSIVELCINNINIIVNKGATVLEAAQRAGFPVPVLCYSQDLPPHTSCFVCVVREINTGRYIPSCAAEVKAGMRIDTLSEDVREMRKRALELLLSEHKGDCEAPCRRACPVHYNIPEILRLMKKGLFTDALKKAGERGILPGVACSSCRAPCEKICRRKVYDRPLSIRLLMLWLSGREGGIALKAASAELSTGKRFQSVVGVLKDIDPEWILPESLACPRPEGARSRPDRESPLDEAGAACEAAACLDCGCRKETACVLRNLAGEYGIRAVPFHGERIGMKRFRPFKDILLEPGKCVKCGICVRIMEGEKLWHGFAFLGKGYDVTVDIPFGRREQSNLGELGKRIIRSCPTGALSGYQDAD